MDPISHSKYMKNSRAQIPLRLTTEMTDTALYRIEKVDRNLGYQARFKYDAAKRWIQAIENKEYVWLGVSGAATPAGLGGLIADLISLGLVDVIVTTGANFYHDLHFAYGLPVRQGKHQVDDNDLWKDGTTRIFTEWISNPYTLKTQDMIVQKVKKRILPHLKAKRSTATVNYEFGKDMLADPGVIDKKGSFAVRAAEYDVPVFFDSGSNHSFGMNSFELYMEGFDADTSPSLDIFESAALAWYGKKQLNVFLGEGGPRNFVQTTAPTVREILYMNDFEGSQGCIRFTTADERTGGLSGSTESEAKSWGKYETASPENDIQIWGEYTLTFPDVAAYVAGKVGGVSPKRLMTHMDEITKNFIDKIRAKAPEKKAEQKRLAKMLPQVMEKEIEARRKAGYVFD